jgi:hypothetical protein
MDHIGAAPGFPAENDYAGETQGATQQASQAFYQGDVHPMERSFFGCLQPCNTVLHRIDFVKTEPLVAIGRGANNHFILPVMRISKFCLSLPSLSSFPRWIFSFFFLIEEKKGLCW